MPSRRTLKHHLFNLCVPKELFRDIRESAIRDNNGEFKQDRLSRRAGGIPTSGTFADLAGWGFLDYRDRATARHREGPVSRYPIILVISNKK